MKKIVTAILSIFLMISMASAAITSVDQINYDSNSQFFTGPVFVFDFTADDSTDQINIFTGRSELSNQAPSGEVKSDISIDAQNTETKARYDLRDTNDLDIYQYTTEKFFLEKIKADFSSQQEWSNYISRQSRDTCFDANQNGVMDDYVASEELNGFNIDTLVRCVSVQKEQNVGEIGSDPRAIFSTKWEVTSGSKTVSTTVTNGETGDGVSTRVGDDVLINWKGSIGTGRNAPVPTDEKIAYSNSRGYTVIDSDIHTGYERTVAGVEDLMMDWYNGYETRDNIENELNTAADSAATPHSSTEFADARFDGFGFSDGSLDLNIDSLRYPEFSIYANACETDSGSSCNAFVQIEKSVGEAGNLRVDGDRFQELSSGNVEASFTNVGDSEGRFSVRISDTSQGFTFTGTSETVNLDAGESTTVNLPVTFDSSSYDQREVSGSATVEVTETSTGQTITDSASLTGVQQTECNPGNKFVKTVDGQDRVLECDSDGLGTTEILRCDEDEFADRTSSGYECKDETQPPTDDECGLNPLCHIQSVLDQRFGGFGILGTFDLIASGLAAVFGFGFAARNLSDYVSPVIADATRFNESGITLVFSLIAGVAAFYFAFVLISSIVVKILIAVGLAAYVYIKGLIPGR